MCTTGHGPSTGVCVHAGTCGYLLLALVDIRVDDLDPIAEATFKTYSLICMMPIGNGLLPLGRRILVLSGLAQGTICLGCVLTMLGLPGLLPCTANTLQVGSFKQVCADFA